MSSLTKDQFIAQLRLSSTVLSELDDDVISLFVDRALRAYSDSSGFAKVKWDVDNAVVDGQDLYDYPTDAVRIISIRTSENLAPVHFRIEDQGSGNQIRLGTVQQRSLDYMMESDYYYNPLVFGGSQVLVTTSIFDTLGYDSFDVEYAALQTMADISDNALEHLTLYVEYLAYNQRSSTTAEEAVLESGEAAESITDSDSTGASTTVKLTSKQSASKTFKDLSNAKLEAFNSTVRKVPYGVRG